MNHRIKLEDAYKGYTLDQDKIFPPDETVARFRAKLINVDLDILERTIRIDNGRLDIPVFFSLCGKDAAAVIGTKKHMGKGGTPEQAEASAVMELAERFSLFSFRENRNNFIIDEYRNLKEKVIPFESIALSVHDNCGDPGPAKDVFSMVPLKWTRAYNLTRDEEVLVPFNWFYTINEFNGASAGNCKEEALLQGICEVMERHVSSIISRRKIKTEGIDISSLTAPLCLELIDKYHKNGIKLFLNDFSLDTGIPSVGALAYDPSTFPEKSEIVWTAGTAPDPQKALGRALTEVAQLAGDFNSGSNYEASGLPKFASLEDARFVITRDISKGINDLPVLSSENIKIEVENCISTLSGAGMEVIAVNTTHPELEIPSFYTIIPGTHFRERASGSSVGMFSAKIVAENMGPGPAIARLKKMREIMPGEYYIPFFLGIRHIDLGDSNKALEYLERALELGPDEEDIPSIFSYMGQCMKEMERYREAIDILSKAEKYDTQRTDIYNLMGFCYFKLKEYRKAIQCFKNVIRIDPSSAIDYANIGSNYRDMGETEKAIHYYSLALELDPSIEFARDNLDRLLLLSANP